MRLVTGGVCSAERLQVSFGRRDVVCCLAVRCVRRHLGLSTFTSHRKPTKHIQFPYIIDYSLINSLKFAHLVHSSVTNRTSGNLLELWTLRLRHTSPNRQFAYGLDRTAYSDRVAQVKSIRLATIFKNEDLICANRFT